LNPAIPTKKLHRFYVPKFSVLFETTSVSQEQAHTTVLLLTMVFGE
jgi:hypothetical protein